MSQKKPLEVAIIGGGEWGRALALAASRAGGIVTLVSRREPADLGNVKIVPNIEDAARSKLIVLAVPSSSVREYAHKLGPQLDGSHFIIHGIRGLVGDNLGTVCDLIREETPVRRVGALGGPALAPELAAGAASVLVIGSQYSEVIAAFREAFSSSSLRVYSTHDRIGLEWASALTGCLAIALGYAKASGQGPGLIAAFTTRGVHEIARVAAAAGGERDTLLGLAGLGDVLAAVGQTGRPEVLYGAALAEGLSPEEAAKKASQRLEALTLLPRITQWAKANNVRIPILSAIAVAAQGGRSRAELVDALMREPMVEGG